MCQGPTLSGETQGKSGSKMTPTEEKRAGQGGKVLPDVMYLKQGRTETVGSRNCRIGKNWAKSCCFEMISHQRPASFHVCRKLLTPRCEDTDPGVALTFPPPALLLSSLPHLLGPSPCSSALLPPPCQLKLLFPGQ